MIRLFLTFVVALLLTDTSAAQQPVWIWSPENGAQAAPTGTCYFRRAIALKEAHAGEIEIAADDGYRLYVNGRLVGQGTGTEQLAAYDVSNLLIVGDNLIAVEAANAAGPAGLVARVTLKPRSGDPVQYSTSGQWRTSLTLADHWQDASFDDREWKGAKVYGSLGVTAPWGNVKSAAEKLAVDKPLPRIERPAGKFQFVSGDRIVLLGDALLEREARDARLETALTAAHPKLDLTFRNLGYSGDNVFARSRAGFDTEREGFDRLRDHLRTLQPSVVLLAYGNNESYDGEPGLPKFKDGLNRLLALLDELHATPIFITPVHQETLAAPLPDATAFNQNRRLYADAIKAAAQKRKAPVIDLFTAMSEAKDHWTDDGIHLTDAGYERFAALVLKQLAIEAPKTVLPPNQAEQLRRTIIAKNQLYFYRWRPQNNTYLFLFRKHEQGNNAVEIPQFDPLVAAQEKQIANLR